MYSAKQRSSLQENCDARIETSAFSSSVKIRGTPARLEDQGRYEFQI